MPRHTHSLDPAPIAVCQIAHLCVDFHTGACGCPQAYPPRTLADPAAMGMPALSLVQQLALRSRRHSLQ